jgi:hypothetical protein
MPCCASQTRHQLRVTALKRTLGWAKIADSPADPRSSAHGQPGCIGHWSIGGLLRLPAWLNPPSRPVASARSASSQAPACPTTPRASRDNDLGRDPVT